MKIIAEKEDVQKFLYSFVSSLVRDRNSWEGWNIMGLIMQEGLSDEQHFDILTSIANLLGAYDGAVIEENNLCLVIYNHNGKIDEEFFKSSLEDYFTSQNRPLAIHHLRLPHDYREAISLISENQDCSAPEDRGEDKPVDLACALPRFDEMLLVWQKTTTVKSKRIIPNVMVVDDDALTRHMVTKALHRDHHLVIAQNISEAVRKQILFTPDLTTP